MNQAWSWALTAVGVAGLYFAGRKKSVGWAIGMAAQVLWVAYAIATVQYGFLASAGLYFAVYLKNWMAWRRQDRDVDSGVNVGSEADSVELSSMREPD